MFFVKDRMDKEEFSMKSCNTSEMLVKFFTKLLQGSLFRRLREVIIGWVHVDILQNYFPPPKKERVENPVSGDEPEIKQKVIYAQIVTGGQIGSADRSRWSKLRTKGARDF